MGERLLSLGCSIEWNSDDAITLVGLNFQTPAPSAGKIAVIAEIIDHKPGNYRWPTTGVPRQSFPYRHLTLTPISLTKLPRGAGSGVIRKQAEKEGIVAKRSLNDFERFSVMVAKKQRRDAVRKTLAKAA
ncbi:hypothetical protein BDR07DRAFT_1419680 [Suillus spraguei]|nr:hypothetical protein BDR07DRAFT_1419680 [Suillus spraguei]